MNIGEKTPVSQGTSVSDLPTIRNEKLIRSWVEISLKYLHSNDPNRSTVVVLCVVSFFACLLEILTSPNTNRTFCIIWVLLFRCTMKFVMSVLIIQHALNIRILCIAFTDTTRKMHELFIPFTLLSVLFFCWVCVNRKSNVLLENLHITYDTLWAQIKGEKI